MWSFQISMGNEKQMASTALRIRDNQLDALRLMYLFILPLYMFRTAQCSSSGDRLY